MRFIAFLPLTLFTIPLFCQTIEKFNENKIIPPSPTATSFSRFGDFKNNYFTGQPNVNIQLYEIKNGDISVPIALSYNLASVKPNEIPGWIGLGWDLGCGGVITRTVRGLPDDLNGEFGRYGYYYDLDQFNFNYNLSNISSGYSQALMAGQRDSEPDIFTFNFKGHTGSFVIGNDRLIQVSSKEKIKIELSVGWDFSITTEDGTNYYFGAGERTTYEIGSEKIWLTSSWFLGRITSHGDVVEFIYTPENVDHRIDRDNKFKTYNFCSATNNVGFSRDLSASLPTYLSEIQFKNGKLKFHLDNWNGYVRTLDSISLHDVEDRYLRSWRFTYNTESRLKLAYVQEASESESLPPYRFIYNNQGFGNQKVLEVGSVDHWGYYNGAKGNVYDFPFIVGYYGSPLGNVNREPDEEFIKAQTLEKIEFPTGGSSEFEYELHDFGNFSKIRLGTSHIEQRFSYAGQCAQGDIGCYEQLFDFDYTTSITLIKPSVIELEIICADCDATYGSSYAHQAKGWWIFADPGTYTINSLFNDPLNGIRSTPDFNVDTRDVRFILKAYDFVESNKGGGLRLKRVIDLDSEGHETVRRYEYKINGISTGILGAFPVYDQLVEYNTLSTCYVMSSRPINKKPGGPDVTYKMVKEILSDGSSVENYYTTHEEFPDGDAGLGFGEAIIAGDEISYILLPAIQNIDLIDNSNQRGLLLNQIFYDASNKIVKNQNYEYAETDAEYSGAIRVEGMIKYGGGIEEYPTVGLGSKVLFKSSWVKKISETETSYSYLGNEQVASVKKINYFFDNPDHMQITRVERIASNGDKLIEKTSFPADYSVNDGGTVIASMIREHIHNSPIQKHLMIEKSGTQYVTNSQIITYASNMLPESILKFVSERPLLGSEFPTYIPNNGWNVSMHQAEIEYQYNSNNKVSQIKENGNYTSFLWGYNSELPIAQVVGAQRNQIFHTSFEDAFGTIGIGVTGEKFYSGLSYTIPINEQPTGINLVMTYWFNDGQWRFQNEIPYSSTIFNPGASKYDEVRVFPKGALITTYSHKPLVGMTSMCDANNEVSYSYYDAMGRLKSVKDSSGNLIKQYKYNYFNSQIIAH